MLAYHNDPSRKSKLVQSVADHIAADRLMQCATGGSREKGCTVACAHQSLLVEEIGLEKSWEKAYNHASLAERMGIPEWIPRLVDTLYEGMNTEDSKQFSQDWIAAIPVGADTSKALPYMLAASVREAGNAIRDQGASEVLRCCDDVLSLLLREIGGEEISHAIWSASAASTLSAARTARADSAACAACAARAARAARTASAARAARADSAACAARAARADSAASAARAARAARTAISASDTWAASAASNKRQAAALLEILRNMPVKVNQQP